jgi:hypothetical protein
MRKIVSTVSSNRGQTVETVLFRHGIAITRLKPGVNEKYSSIKNRSRVLFFLLCKIIVAIPFEAS